MNDQVDPTEGPDDIEPTLPLDRAEQQLPTLDLGLRSDSNSSSATPGKNAPQNRTTGGLVAGAVLGNYELIRPVGEGAQGQVWEGRNRIADRPVALKFLSRKLAKDRRAITSMRTEAAVLFDLTHEAIVRLMNIEQVGEHAFLVMEFLGGPSLAGVINQRKRATGKGLYPEECLWLLQQLAPALDYARKQQVTHRDIKPGNMMLTRPIEPGGSLLDYRGRAKLCDFGIAFVSVGKVDADRKFAPTGTPPFMAPEVLRGELPTPAADMYSLGATLYALSKGKPPYKGTLTELRTKFSQGPPEPLESGNRSFDAAIARALSHDPEKRHSSVDDLLYQASGRRIGQRAERRTRQNLAAVASAGLIAAFALAFVAWRFSQEATEAELLSPGPTETLTASDTLEVRFLIDNADVDTVQVGWSGLANEVSPQSIRRGADGEFRTQLPFPDEGKFTLLIESDGITWAAQDVTYDAALRVGSHPISQIDPGWVMAGSEVTFRFDRDEETITVRNRTGGKNELLPLQFIGREAHVTMPVEPRPGGTRWQATYDFQILDEARNTETFQIEVDVYDRIGVLEEYTSSFPLSGKELHPWDQEQARRDLEDWMAAVAAEPLLNSQDKSDIILRGDERGRLIAALTEQIRTRPDPELILESPDDPSSGATLEHTGGKYRLYTRDDLVTIHGRVLHSRDSTLQLRSESQGSVSFESISREASSFAVQLTADRRSSSTFLFEHQDLPSKVYLEVTHDSTAPSIGLAQPILAPQSQDSFRIHIQAADSDSGVIEVLVGDVVLVENEGPANTWTGTLPLVQEGLNRFAAEARDRAGNRARLQINIERDTLSPRHLIPEPIERASVATGQTESLRFVFDEPIAHASGNWKVLDAGGEQLSAGSIDPEAISKDGTTVHIALTIPDERADTLTVELTGVDSAGNEGVGSVTWPIRFDPWGSAPAFLADANEILTQDELIRILPSSLATSPYVVFADGRRFPRALRHRATGIEFVIVPPGNFELGDKSEKPGLSFPPRQVHMSAYYIARTEVSGSQFMRGKRFARYEDRGFEDSYLPIKVDWRDARLWCNSSGFDLPTEAQWEYAASGPKNNAYPWGPAFDGDLVNHGPPGVSGKRSSLVEVDAPAYRSGASWCGAVQMSGNIIELCRDVIDLSSIEDGSVDPIGVVDTGENVQRTVRGGSHYTRAAQANELETSFRKRTPKVSGQPQVGFRPILKLTR